MSRIGEKIMKVRIKNGMSRKQLAKRCGISESYISDVESGRKVINEQMTGLISKALGENLSEPMYDESEEPVQDEEAGIAQTDQRKEPTSEWESAFSSVIKDIPVYNIDMVQVGLRHLPVIGKRVEGYNPEKLIFVNAGDNSMGAFRIKKGDTVMVNLGSELSNGFFLLEYQGERMIRQIKLLYGSKVLLLYGDGDVKTLAVAQREIKIIGRCIKAEFNLTGN